MKTYIYPENLTARARLWLWNLKDLLILIGCVLIAVLVFTKTGNPLPFAMVAVYAFLSMRVSDTSFPDYIKQSISFLFLGQQVFYWEKE